MKQLVILLAAVILFSCGGLQDEMEDELSSLSAISSVPIENTDTEIIPEMVTDEEYGELKLYQTLYGNYYWASITTFTLPIDGNSQIGPGKVGYKRVSNEAHTPGYMIEYVTVDNYENEYGDFGHTFKIDQTNVGEYFYNKSAGLTMDGVAVFSNSNQHYHWLVFWVAEDTIIRHNK